jgi:hypothetical protein
MKYLPATFLLVILLITSGCVSENKDSAATSVPTSQIPITSLSATPLTTIISAPVTTVVTTIPTPTPVQPRKITDGFWCRKTTMNVGNAPTDIEECYQFFTDGTFKWGYSPGKPMGKSMSCLAPDVQCKYSLISGNKYEVQGGYFYTLSGDLLIDPHDLPYFAWSSTGIP